MLHWDSGGRFAKELAIAERPVSPAESVPRDHPAMLKKKKRTRQEKEAPPRTNVWPRQNDFVIVTPPSDELLRFWVGQVHKINTDVDQDGDPRSLKVWWYEASEQDGRYRPSRTEQGHKHLQHIELSSVTYVFSKLTTAGKIPQRHLHVIETLYGAVS